MAISKSLSVSLDQLASAIREANEFVSESLPTAVTTSIYAGEDSYWVEDEEAYDKCDHYLVFSHEDGFCKSVCNQHTGDELEETPLMQLPIVEREKYVALFPNFLKEAKSKMHELPLKVTESAERALKAIEDTKSEFNMA